MPKLTRTLTFATTAIGSVVIAAANLGNAFLRASLPTPLEYAESHGQVYSELTKSGLKEFDHIKVMEHGSAELNIFCKINLLGALRSSLCSKGGFKPDFAYDPSIADWILGARPSIISQPYTEDTLKNEVARLAWRPLANTQLTPSIYLTYRILHETGHFSKKFAHDPSLQYQSELYADRSTIPALKREFGEIGAEFPLHYRALHQHMIDPHNNYLSLSRPELEDQNAEYALQVKEENSQRAFFETIKPCVKYAANKLPILFRSPTQAEQDLRDGITMECWANEYMNRRSTDPLLARRQEGLAKAHEYFFLPTPSKD